MNTPNPVAIRVWDAPLRLFHALLALSFAGAWLSAESERWRAVHVTLGLTMAGLVVFRLLWGVLGSRHARFADFVRGPGAVAAYLRSIWLRRPEQHSGHNPAGGWVIVAMLALIGVTSALGWAAYSDFGGDAVAEGHEVAASLMLGLVGVHLLGIVVSSVLHRENLARAMVTGRKAGDLGEDNGPPRRTVAVLLLAAVLGFWALQWQAAPLVPAPTVAARHQQPSDDDD